MNRASAPDCGNLSVQVAGNALTLPSRAFYELAHGDTVSDHPVSTAVRAARYRRWDHFLARAVTCPAGHFASTKPDLYAAVAVQTPTGQDHATQREDCDAAASDTAPERTERSDDADRGQAARKLIRLPRCAEQQFAAHRDFSIDQLDSECRESLKLTLRPAEFNPAVS